MELTCLNHNINKKLFLFSCCIPVKGSGRSAIYDLQRDDMELIPNTLIDFIHYIDRKPVKDILDEWENNEVAQEYLEFLIEKELVFFASEDHFPKLSTKCFNDDTSRIEFMTIIWSDFLWEKIQLIGAKIDNLGVKRLHIHFPDDFETENIINNIEWLHQSCVTSLSISLPYLENFNPSAIREERLKSIYFYNSPHSDAVGIFKIKLYFLEVDAQKLFIPKSDIDTMAINHRAFLTGKNANLGLYKTVFINASGGIQLNFSDSREYGNILDPEPEQTLRSLSKVWNIRRDQITPCRNCEFRYACTANYVPEYNENTGKYFVNCNYNPYTNEWSH